MGTFIPHVIVRNLLATTQTVTVEYNGAQGTQQVVLPPLTLAGYTSQDTTLESVMGELPLPLPFCSIRIQHDGPPGSVIASVSSLEIGGNSAIDSPVANEGDGWAGSGAYAWRVDQNTQSVLFLTNQGAKECPIAMQVHADGVAYYVANLSLKPRETRAVDLRKLRDAQQADLQAIKSRREPRTASLYGVGWPNCPSWDKWRWCNQPRRWQLPITKGAIPALIVMSVRR